VSVCADSIITPQVGCSQERGTAVFTRFTCFAILTLVYLVPATPVQAEDWFLRFWSGVARDTKRRNCWPKPFEVPDREAVRAPISVMISNGWRRQNMLSEHHFDPETGKLNEAGYTKIRWILSEPPQSRRTIFVHVGRDAQETASRVDQVQQLALQLVPQGPLPPVMVTNIPRDLGQPASDVNSIMQKYDSSIPAPRLPSGGSTFGQGG